jgi:hypothetical protein
LGHELGTSYAVGGGDAVDFDTGHVDGSQRNSGDNESGAKDVNGAGAARTSYMTKGAHSFGEA